jgi:hypothetical protein
MNSSSNGTDIDQLLRSFFRRELPAHWPAAPAGDSTTIAQPARSMASNRVLIGISLAGLLAVYLGLAAFFPRENASGLNPSGAPLIGHRAVPGKSAPGKSLPASSESRP